MTLSKFREMLFKEPAKLIGWIIATVISVCAAIVAILNNVIEVLPESWKPKVNTAIIAVAAVGIAAARIQAVITRAKVYSPETFENQPYDEGQQKEA